MKENLIIFSYYEPGTGFYNVIYNLIKVIAGSFKVHYVGIGYDGEIKEESNYVLYPTTSKTGDYGANSCVELAESIGRGSLLIINDLWLMKTYDDYFYHLKPEWKLVAYVPIDGMIVDGEIVAHCKFLDALVVYTDYAKKEISRCIKDKYLFKNGSCFPRIFVMPHGLDNCFYRMDRKQKLESRRLVFSDDEGWMNAFIILNANRFTQRKRLDITFSAFREFCKDKDDARLYFHQGLIQEKEYDFFYSKIKEYNLSEKIKVTAIKDTPCDMQRLNRIYNACDVGINTSVGEGWGLVNFEHGATGAAQIVPGHSACLELWNGYAEVVPPAKKYQVRNRMDSLMWEVCSPDVTQAMNRYYYDRNYLSEMSDAAEKMTKKEKYRWSVIACQWVSILSDDKTGPKVL